MNAWFKIASALFLVGAASCGPTPICMDGVSVWLERPLTEAGSYELRVSVPELGDVVCDVQLPDFSAACADGRTPRPADEMQTFIVHNNGTDELAGFFISGTPASLSVRIARDGTEVFFTEIAPQYTHEELNGQDCPTAKVDVAN